MLFKECFTGAFQVFVNFPLCFLTDFLVSLGEFSMASSQIFGLNLWSYGLSIRFFGRTILVFIPFFTQIRIALLTRFGEHRLQLICNIHIFQIGSLIFLNKFGGFFQKLFTIMISKFWCVLIFFDLIIGFAF